jgi:hypothetical protein
MDHYFLFWEFDRRGVDLLDDFVLDFLEEVMDFVLSRFG